MRKYGILYLIALLLTYVQEILLKNLSTLKIIFDQVDYMTLTYNSIKYQVNRSNKQTRSRHKRGLAGRGIFRDYINEYLFPDAEVKPNSGLIFSLILAIVAVPLLLSTARALPEIRAGQAPPSSPQPGKNHIFL